MLKVFESFAGIGTQRMALGNLGIDHEVTAISEVDEYALLSYHAIHTVDTEVNEASEEEMQRYMEEKNIPLDPKGKRKILKNKRLKDLYVASVASNNLGDISKITDGEIPKVDLFTYSFPCQDISLAGKRKGLDKNSGTRSSLLWECEKIIETVKPKYLLMENVKALVNKNNKPQFDIWLEYLEELGYKNFWEVLNAKDYEIPQNRERVFVVSILDENADYKFPTKMPLTLRLKDILEDNVDDNYYLSQEQVDNIKLSTYETNKRRIQEKDYCDTLCARDFKDPKCVKVKNNASEPTILIPKRTEYGKAIRKKYEKGEIKESRHNMTELNPREDGLSNTLTTVQKDNLVLEQTKTEPIAKRIGGIFDKVGKTHQAGSIWDKEGLAPTLDTMQGGWRQPCTVVSRGRYDGNDEIHQQLEANKEGATNTITTVQKDNYVAEPLGTIYSNASKQYQRGLYTGLSRTLKANNNDVSVVFNDYRIRKLTPLECWRLMGVSDEDFEKASKAVSNSQLYKQAGNAIVVNVLEEIFKELFI